MTNNKDGGIPSPRAKLYSLKTKASTKAKNALEIGVSKLLHKDGEDRDEGLVNTQDDPAFNPTLVARELKNEHAGQSGPIGKTKSALKKSNSLLSHPRRTARKKAKQIVAGKISTIQSSLPRTGLDLLAVDAKELSSGSSSQLSSDEGESDVDWNQKRIQAEKLEERREGMKAAWITRHTRRVRVVPKEHIKFPEKEAFMEQPESGNPTRFRWEKWLGYLIVYYTQDFSAQYIDDFEEPPFDLETIRNHTERLVMASAPWQMWLMDVRSVYRWEDPARTGRWFALFVLLWYQQRIMGFLYAFIIYYVIRNRYYPTSVRHLRASIRRSLDRESAAFQLGEFIDRHGRDEWLEPFIEELGPLVQLQLGDLANMLEVLANFYAWKTPKKTVSSLLFFGACLLVSQCADMEFCMKVFWFIAGGTFFLCWPISSHFPQFRYLVSPFKWMLWEIPTHAEWAFRHLRVQCQISREIMITRNVAKNFQAEINGPTLEKYAGSLSLPHPHISFDEAGGDDSDFSSGSEDWESATSAKDVLSDMDIIAFPAYCEGVLGRLVVHPAGLRFVRARKEKEVWDLPFIEIQEMLKFHSSKTKTSKLSSMLSGHELELHDIHGRVWELELVRDRDEAFNYIIGFSNLQWQSLQTGPKGLKEKSMNGDKTGRG